MCALCMPTKTCIHACMQVLYWAYLTQIICIVHPQYAAEDEVRVGCSKKTKNLYYANKKITGQWSCCFVTTMSEDRAEAFSSNFCQLKLMSQSKWPVDTPLDKAVLTVEVTVDLHYNFLMEYNGHVPV